MTLPIPMSLNGIVGGTRDDTGSLWDEALRRHSIDNLEDIDAILLGRHTQQEEQP